MGILATTAGQNSEAMLFFKKAVEAKPDFLQYWISYILILIELRQSEDAEKALLEAGKKALRYENMPTSSSRKPRRADRQDRDQPNRRDSSRRGDRSERDGNLQSYRLEVGEYHGVQKLSLIHI